MSLWTTNGLLQNQKQNDANSKASIEKLKEWLKKDSLSESELSSVRSLLSTIPVNASNSELLNLRNQLNAKYTDASKYYSSGETQKRQIQEDYEKAKQANESRYQDILGQYNAMENVSAADQGIDYSEALKKAQENYSTGMKYLEGAGTQEASDIRQSHYNRQQKFASDAISRGVNVPGLMTSTERGIDRDMTADLGRLNERLNTQKLAAHSTLSNNQLSTLLEKLRASQNAYGNRTNLKTNKLNFMERRTDAYPDIANLTQLYSR